MVLFNALFRYCTGGIGTVGRVRPPVSALQ
jgi:hypothetical protein